MTLCFLTNEVLATELWALKIINPAPSTDTTTKATVGKSAVCTYFKFRPGVTVTASGDFPDISLAKSGWRTVSPLNTTVRSWTWTFKVKLVNQTKYGFSVKVAVRLSKSSNSDGSNATLIVVSESPNVKQLPATAGATVTDSWTWSASSITFNNEYLFAEYRIHIEAAASSTTAQCAFVCDENTGEEAIDVPPEMFISDVPNPQSDTLDYGYTSVSVGVVETIVAMNYPMLYLPKPLEASMLLSKVEGATITSVANDFPEVLIKKGKAQELRSKFT